MSYRLISAYTPSNTDPKVLKRIFVQREKLLERIVDRLSASMKSGDKHHILLVGPRGSGKTHLVSLAAWELQQQKDLDDVMRVAWLGEDDTFSGLIHLAFGIAQSLATEYPDEFPQDFKSDVRGLPVDDAAISVLNTVIRNLKHRHLLVITENLDQTFGGLGDSGQKKLRAFLQETRRIATLATSQQLFAAVSSRKEAFFGFFDTQHLNPLSVADAQQLIWKIAREQRDQELEQFLGSPDARYRLRALHHLAGGNHRMYVLLAEFLTRETLDDLVSAFEKLAEDMTPYFQERIRSLPDQQRQLVQCLCEAGGAITVKEIAKETFIAEGNCSKQLGNLKSKGYVRSEKRGKESYYDMAEPLMRLCLEVKNQRGRPLQLVARFLKAWFPTGMLELLINRLERSSRAAKYCEAALSIDQSFEKSFNESLAGEIREKLVDGAYDQANDLTDELAISNRTEALLLQAYAASFQNDLPGELHALTQFIGMPDAPADQKVTALLQRGNAHGQRGEVDLELGDYKSAIKVPNVASDQKAAAFLFFGSNRWRNNDWKSSFDSFEQGLTLNALSDDLRTAILFSIAEPMIAIHRLSDVLAALTRAFEEGDKESEFYGGTASDLLSMILRRGPAEWSEYIAAIAPLFVQHGAADKLGHGVTRSIQSLDEGDYSASQLDVWNDAWQAAGRACEALQIPLECLDAAVEVIKSNPKTDRPLFRLPLEIRQLIRPLLNKSLGPPEN